MRRIYEEFYEGSVLLFYWYNIDFITCWVDVLGDYSMTFIIGMFVLPVVLILLINITPIVIHITFIIHTLWFNLVESLNRVLRKLKNYSR